MAAAKFERSLKKYAEIIVRVGLNLRAGQRLIINNASTRGVPLHAAPLVRELTRTAYEVGARFVDVIWNDEALLRTRVQHAPADSFNEYPDWHIRGLLDITDNGDAMLTIRSNDPDLLNGLDPERVGAWQKTHLERFAPVGMAITSNQMNWCVVSAASPAWAAKVFPDLKPKKAETKLWEAIFKITRVDRPNPIAAWEAHIKNLLKRTAYLNAKKYTGLKYTAPGTDLTIGLPRGHKWLAAREHARNGVEFVANLPTEEVFTLPHRDQTTGTVRATMPLSYGGTLIEDFSLTFENGRAVNVTAKKGEAILKKLVETDDGASRFGEAALVPVSSPIARRGHLFYDTLIDENASCHLALGRGYHINMEDSQGISDEEFMRRGGNVSLTHVDFMIGSDKMDIDGIKEDGTPEPVMHKGEWAFKV
jgi:aminopeptidase